MRPKKYYRPKPLVAMARLKVLGHTVAIRESSAAVVVRAVQF